MIADAPILAILFALAYTFGYVLDRALFGPRPSDRPSPTGENYDKAG